MAHFQNDDLEYVVNDYYGDVFEFRGGSSHRLDLEWKLIYVGSAEDETYDQLLESVLVGPVNVGNYRFVFQADPPDPSKIHDEDIIGIIGRTPFRGEALSILAAPFTRLELETLLKGNMLLTT